MAALNINEYYDCFSCEAADEHGNGCRHGLLFPAASLVSRYCLRWETREAAQTINSRRNNYGVRG